jgi:hypothetical protein
MRPRRPSLPRTSRAHSGAVSTPPRVASAQDGRPSVVPCSVRTRSRCRGADQDDDLNRGRPTGNAAVDLPVGRLAWRQALQPPTQAASAESGFWCRSGASSRSGTDQIPGVDRRPVRRLGLRLRTASARRPVQTTRRSRRRSYATSPRGKEPHRHNKPQEQAAGRVRARDCYQDAISGTGQCPGCALSHLSGLPPILGQNAASRLHLEYRHPTR